MKSQIIVALVVRVTVTAHTEISAERVAVVCRKSVDIYSDPEYGSSWRAN